MISGLATGLFSIPEGMAYAQLAGVNPVYGLYSGIVAVIVSSLTTGTILMMSTLTSAIALGHRQRHAECRHSGQPDAAGALHDHFPGGRNHVRAGHPARLGSIVNFVSNAVMTGFVAGTSLLIILGQEHHLTGYSPVGSQSVAEDNQLAAELRPVGYDHGGGLGLP